MNRAGKFVDNLTGEATYQSFKPNPLPPVPEILLDEEIVKLVVDANRQLAKLDTASQLISNADLFISMYVRKEALISSQIEGTQCTLGYECKSGWFRCCELCESNSVCNTTIREFTAML